MRDCPDNQHIRDALVKTYNRINDTKYENILVSVSGGSDSDVMMDMVERVSNRDPGCIHYVWFNTGLEYQATKEHLKYLEEKYSIEIDRQPPVKNIVSCCHHFGQPFLSKMVSENMSRLQDHGFQWEDEPLDVLMKKYPNCKTALRWWTSDYTSEGFSSSSFSIDRNRFLKSFILKNPPWFKINFKCCWYAKKLPSHHCEKRYKREALLKMTGVRSSEGGIRAAAYKTCFKEGDGLDTFMPILWFTNEDKEVYDKHYNITHSRCYTEYGLRRTGCCGCPFNLKLAADSAAMEKYEPKLYKAVCNVFKDSYEYTRMYREFVKEEKAKEKAAKIAAKQKECSTKVENLE